MKLYILRHGQTDYNVKGIIQGTLPTKLNEIGIKQVLDRKKDIDKIDIDLIITSPLNRTIETTNIINKNRNLKVIIDERLKERGFGKAVGDKDEVYLKKLDLYWDFYKNYTDENEIEPIQDLLNRTNDFLNDIKTKYSDKNILAITHGAVVVSFIKIIEGILKSETDISNCELIEYEI